MQPKKDAPADIQYSMQGIVTTLVVVARIHYMCCTQTLLFTVRTALITLNPNNYSSKTIINTFIKTAHSLLHSISY